MSNLAMHQSGDSTENSRPVKSRWRKWLIASPIVLVLLAIGVHFLAGEGGQGFFEEPIASPWMFSFGVALALILLIGVLAWVLSTLHAFKRGAVAIVVVVGLIVLFYVEENSRGRLRWRQFKSRWEARGEKFDMAGVTPLKVPDDENFALTPLVLSSYANVLDRYGHRVSFQNPTFVNRLDMPIEIGSGSPTNGLGNWQAGRRCHLEAWQAYYRKLASTTNLFPIPAQPQTPGADVLLALSLYDANIEELRQAAALPASRFPLNYDTEVPASILLPHLAPMKGCVRLLALRALAELEAGKSDAALDDVKLGLRLVESLRSEPFLITHLVRIAMWNILDQVIWDGLATRRWTDAQLAALDRELAKLNFVADYRTGMRGENVFQAASIDYLRAHPEMYGNLVDSSETGEAAKLAMYLVPSGWYCQNQLRGSRFILEKLLPVADAAGQSFSPAAAATAEDWLKQLRPTPFNKLSQIFLAGLATAERKFARAQVEVNLCRTACALERYKIGHGRYPDSLSALAPDIIATVPVDAVGGQSLHYRLTDSGTFILYSVGWNNKDDNGSMVLTKTGAVDFEQGDLVWRYPDDQKP